MKLDTCFLCGSSESRVVHKGTRGGYEDIDVLACKHCGLVRLSESIEDSESFYADSGMRNHARERIEDLQISTRKDDERRFRFAENMIEGRSVLDFGCGDGGFLVRAKQVAKQVEGVELETVMRTQLKEAGISCHASIDEIGIFDIITLFHVLEHLEDPLLYLRKFKEHLSASGMLLIEVPNAEDALLKQYQSKPFADFTYWHCHIYLYTNTTLALLAKKAGYQVTFIQQVQRYPLANHLYWLSQGRPGGHFAWSFLQDERLDKAYGEKMAALGMADTILAGLTPLSTED